MTFMVRQGVAPSLLRKDQEPADQRTSPYTPPPPQWTNKLKTLPSLMFRTRAVKTNSEDSLGIDGVITQSLFTCTAVWNPAFKKEIRCMRFYFANTLLQPGYKNYWLLWSSYCFRNQFGYICMLFNLVLSLEYAIKHQPYCVKKMCVFRAAIWTVILLWAI